MRAVIQRINGAEITINGGETRKVGEGLVVFICAMEGDTDAQADFLVQKVCGLRVFKDENDKMNRSLEDIKGDMRFGLFVGYKDNVVPIPIIRSISDF